MVDEDFLNDIADAAEGEKAGAADLAALVERCNEMAKLEGELARLEEKAAEVKKQMNELAINQIPKMMHDVGIRSVELADRRVVKIDSDLKASLPKKRSDEVMAYVREHGGSDIIKKNIEIDIGRGGDNVVASILAEATKLGLDAKVGETIAAPTYAKWIRDRLKDNKPTDLALLGAFMFERAKIV